MHLQGMPDWQQIAQELPPMEAFLSKLERWEVLLTIQRVQICIIFSPVPGVIVVLVPPSLVMYTAIFFLTIK